MPSVSPGPGSPRHGHLQFLKAMYTDLSRCSKGGSALTADSRGSIRVHGSGYDTAQLPTSAYTGRVLAAPAVALPGSPHYKRQRDGTLWL